MVNYLQIKIFHGKIRLGDDGMATENKRIIPVKNYVYLGIILIVSVALVYYFYLWYVAYRENSLFTPIMDDCLQVINYEELDNYLLENQEAYIYVSVLGNEDIRSFEKKFKSALVEYTLCDQVLYLDVTEELSQRTRISFMSQYALLESDIPCILVFENGELIDTFVISENVYSSRKVIKYLTLMGVFEDD